MSSKSNVFFKKIYEYFTKKQDIIRFKIVLSDSLYDLMREKC
jgi:hypothetical protein